MADKTVSIKEATDKQIDELLSRIRKESELQMLIANIKRRASSQPVPYDAEGVSTELPIESLYHHGVPGMRWGRRKRTSVFDHPKYKKILSKFLNSKHGSKYKLNDDPEKELKEVEGKRPSKQKGKTTKKDTSSQDHKEAQKIKKKKLHEMSNDDLAKLNKRLQLERSYKDLSSRDVSAGRKFAQDVISEIGKEMAKDALKSGIKTGLKLAFKKH